MRFAKGHGTGNDFVILPDPEGELTLTPELVAALCDRRRGIGADGVLRVVRDGSGWFMDYRNADGSLAEMCGNGARVYARYLVESGLDAGPTISLDTRAGAVVAEVGPSGVSVTMPTPTVYSQSSAILSGVAYEGTVVTCGNPHLVCAVEDLSGVDLSRPPQLDPDVFPAGANVEFVRPVGHLHVRMRVIERGSGETQSCGSGACAVAAVGLRMAGADAGTVTVDVPGGRLSVSIDGDRCVLTGPAVIVFEGVSSLP